MSRLVIVSNRLPLSITKSQDGIDIKHSAGGVATGISSICKPGESLWVGWPGIAEDVLDESDKNYIGRQLRSSNCEPVYLDEAQVDGFYYGFCNKTVWPLFHYFPLYTTYEDKSWEQYEEVNRLYCEEVLKVIKPGDKIWVHDYQLMLLPKMLRERVPDAQIGFFLHIPFPTFELMRLLPWRKEILEGMLGADLVGFHEYDYMRHFLSSVYRICGYDHSLSDIYIGNRVIRVDAFPMGIDYEKFANAREKPEVRAEIEKLSEHVSGGRKLVISVDRLDYTKGIINRLEAFDYFLTKYPQYRGRVSMVVVAVPSREQVQRYADLRMRVERLIGRINGAYGSIDWTPISYMYRSLPFDQLVALYNVADVGLITPLRDGMNLVAKEYVATKNREDSKGVLILSEMAGAIGELAEAIPVNPHNKLAVVEAIRQAIEMPADEQWRRNKTMQARLSRYTVGRWAHDFIEGLDNVKETQDDLALRRYSPARESVLLQEYKDASKRLFLLDYDGTLVGYSDKPQGAMPDTELLNLIGHLAEDSNNELVIISGRDKEIVEKWLGELDVNLVCEHGAVYKGRGQEWRFRDVSDEWKSSLRPILELYVDRTPGAVIEEKSYSLAWHWRKSDPGLAWLRMQELKDAIFTLTSNRDIGVFEGDKVLEVKHIGITKGTAAEHWLGSGEEWDFVMAAGDDYTDEDMFSVLPRHAHSFKIGHGASMAKYRIDSVYELRKILRELLNA